MQSENTAFANIIVGVEMSAAGDRIEATSRRALECALQLAREMRPSVRVVHATGAAEHYRRKPEGDNIWVPAPGLSDAGKAGLEQALTPFREAGVSVTLELPEERAWLAIAETAIRSGADLVMVGKREPSHFDFDERRLGAVASQLLRRCPTAVWAVDPHRASIPRRVLVATDLEQPMCERLIRAGASVARAFGADLNVLHASTRSWPLSTLEDESARARRIDSCRQQLAAATRNAIGDASVTLHAVAEAPASAIVQCARDIDADLIVLGTSSNRLRHALVGHTAERLFGMSDRSLLALKPAGFEMPG